MAAAEDAMAIEISAEVCSEYPNCTNSYPLPQKGTVLTTDDLCPECNAPIIKVKNRGREYKMCLDMTCKTKDAWRKKAEEKKSKKK